MAYQTAAKRTTNTPPKEGSLASMAVLAGMTLPKFAESNIHTKGRVGQLARLYYTMQGTHGSGKTNMAKPGDGRDSLAQFYQIG